MLGFFRPLGGRNVHAEFIRQWIWQKWLKVVKNQPLAVKMAKKNKSTAWQSKTAKKQNG
jgi:hypothetical protein